MAIHVVQANLLVSEIPKTGTTWVRHALKQCDIVWNQLWSNTTPSPRHALPCHFPGRFHHRLVTLRHPATWLVSYWRMHIRRPSHWRTNTWFAHQLLRGEGMPGSFDEFVRRILETEPGFVTRMFEWYCGPACSPWIDFILRQETLAADLAAALQQLGYDISEEQLSRIPRRNISRAEKPEWDAGLRREFLQAEAPGIRRWEEIGKQQNKSHKSTETPEPAPV